MFSLVIGRAYVQFSDWTGGRAIPTVGSNAGAAVLPFQNWRPFKEAFAPELVERALKETAGTVQHIADPFGGSGTTALAAQFLGAKPTTIEVNPFLTDLIKAKIAPINFDLAAETRRTNHRPPERRSNTVSPRRPARKRASMDRPQAAGVCLVDEIGSEVLYIVKSVVVIGLIVGLGKIEQFLRRE